MKFDDAVQLLKAADNDGLRRVLIVTALPLELKAVLKDLKPVGSCTARDGSVFELARFNGTACDWLVVVGESGAGNLQAQATTTTALNDFGGFDLMLFVGVAATRKKLDAPIGSVVAANLVYQASSGKYEKGNFYSRPREFPIQRRLLGLIKKIAREERWHERLKPPYGGVMPGDAQYPQPFPPGALVAPIISVEAVSADVNSDLERQISDHFQDAVALEMEGYGAAHAAHNENLPCVIVRGISDAREGKEAGLDKIHQPIAAAHGAAFGFEIIDLWGSNYPSEIRGKISTLLPPVATPTLQPPVSVASPIQALPTPSAQGANPTLEPQTTLVLSFTGMKEDFPPATRDQIVAVVRALTGNPNLQMVGEEIGSYHLLLKANESDRAKIDTPKVYAELLDKFGAELIGVMTEAEYRSAPSLQSKLVDASHALMTWPQTLPDGTLIERPELQKLLSLVENAEGTTTALLGAPGSGKTALLATFSHNLKLQGIPFLAIKADLLGTNVASERDLQQELSLPELPSQILRKLSLYSPVVLIIDQLDALAGYVDLKTGRLSSLLNLVRSLGGQRGIHIVLSARTFEFEHDTRLKSVRAESLSLELPPWSSILKILSSNNIGAAGWPGDAQEVMRSPQALATLLKLAKPNKAEPFTTYQSALEELWIERVLEHPEGQQLSSLASTIAEDMAEMETLWVARSRYDNHAKALKILLADGILTHPNNPGSIGFSHQTVFEFALARAFAQKEGRLSGYVLEREDSLFVRPKLWAALNYLRSVEKATYLTELKAIWLSPHLRLHLRHLLIEFLGQQKEPIQEEVAIFEGALASPDRQAALQAIVGNEGWFTLFKFTSISAAMTEQKEAGVATAILSRACSFAPADVIELIKTRWLPCQEWDSYAWAVLQDCRNWDDRHLQAATTIIERSPLSPFAFDYMISTIGAEQPEIAMKLVLTRLNRNVAHAKEEADEGAAKRAAELDLQARLFTGSPAEAIAKVAEASDGWDCLEALAKSIPEQFLRSIWPWFTDVFTTLRELEKDQTENYPVRYLLDYRFDEEDSLKLGEHPILGALRTAAETFADRDSDHFLAWLDEVQNEEAAPAQRLFAHALASQPECYASRALKFLISDKRRFHLGNIEDYSGTTKRLVEAVSPYWSGKEFDIFVAEVNEYSPQPAEWRDAKSRQYFYQDTARLKAELFEALPPDRLSTETRAFINEERRRLGPDKRGATFSGPTWVGPSMSAEEIRKADDEDVVNAFRELPDATGWDNPKTWQKGGNVQLSRAFADFAKSNHSRAVEIIGRFDPTIGARAAGYALEAMAEDAPPELIASVMSDLENRGFAGEEFRGGTARAIERLIKRDVKIDDSVLNILVSWLSEADAPTIVTPEEAATDGDEEIFRDALPQAEPDEEKRRDGSILWGMGGISILPHGNFPILEVIIRILLDRRDCTRLLTILEEHLGRPESEKVWTSLLRLFPYIRPDDKTQLETFLLKLFKQYPDTATSHEAVVFLAHAYWTVPNFVRKVLTSWSENASPFVQQAFGELTTLVWLMKPELEWAKPMVETVLKNGVSPARTGAAYAAVHVWAETDKKERASQLLEQVIKSADDETWSAVVDLFRIVDELTPAREWIAVLEAIADQIPLQSKFNSSFVIERLQTLLPHHAPLVAKISIALASKWSEELNDMRTGTAAVAPELVDIAITLHRLGPQTRQAGLELFEKLLTINAYTARETLDQIDNRFRENAPQARLRLPRRNRRPARRAKRAART